MVTWAQARTPLPQVHTYIISYLKKEMPSVFGKENKKKQLILKLPVIFAKIQLEHHISPGDFPDCQKMQVGGLPEERGEVGDGKVGFCGLGMGPPKLQRWMAGSGKHLLRIVPWKFSFVS